MAFSALLSRVSSAVLALGGIALLFASDTLLPAVIAGFPPIAAWLGQLLAAAWLALATLNWLQRNLRMGGIYGRPIVLANLALYFITALSLVRAAIDGETPPVVWAVLGVSAVLAAAYAALLLRGPFDNAPDAS